MSRFGQRTPGIIPIPSATPNVSNVVDVGVGLATALGVINAGIVNKSIDIGQQMRDQEFAQRLKVDEAEIASARTRLDTEKQQTEQLQLGIANDEQAAEARRLASIENLGLQDKLSQMSPEDGARWLAENPAVDPKNAETYARSLGHSLAMSGTTRMYKRIADAANPEDISVTSLIAEELQSAPFDKLHPAARDAFTDDLLREGTGFLRGRFNQVTQHRTQQAAKNAMGDSQRSITRSVVGELPPPAFIERWRDNAKLRPDAGSTDVDLARTMADDIVAASTDYMKVWGNDPAMLRKFNSWVDETFPKTSAFNREVRTNLDGDQLSTFIDNHASKVETANLNAQFEQLGQSITAAGEADNVPQLMALGKHLETMPDTAQKQEMRDRLDHQLQTIDNTNMMVNEMVKATNAGTPMPKGYTPEALDKYAERYGVTATIQNTGDVPPKAIKDIKQDLSNGDFASAYATYHAINELSPVRADAISRTIENGDRLRIAAQMLRNVDPTSDQATAARVLGVLGNGASSDLMAKADAILNDPNATTITKALLATTNTTYGSGLLGTGLFAKATVTSVPASPAAIRAYRDAFKFHYAELSMGTDPTSAKDLASSRAQESVKQQFVNVGTAYFPSNIFGVGTAAAPDADGIATLTDAIGRFERMEASVNSKPILDKPLSYQGSGYIPGAKVGADGRVIVERFLKWDTQTREFSVIDKSDEAFDVLSGMVSGRIDPREVSNRADIMFREEYGSRDLAEFNKQDGGAMVRAMKSHAIREYMSIYGPLPDRSDPDFSEKMQSLLDIQEWLATDAGWAVTPSQETQQK